MPTAKHHDSAIDSLALDNPLWRFSLSIWDNSVLRARLMTLQNKYGLNINLVLTGLWLGESGLLLADPKFKLNQALSWHRQRVIPLRTQRVAVPDKAVFSELRRALLDAEVAAERLELSILYRACSQHGQLEVPLDTLKLVCDNLVYVLKLCKRDYNSQVAHALNELVALFKSELKRSQIDMYFAQVTDR